jgi:hypothetical protein
VETGRRGVIDSIGAGFALVHRWPFLLVLPILVDAFLWLVPRVSPRPVLERLVDQFGALTEGGGALGESEAVREQVVQNFETLGGANLLGLLGWQVPTFLHPLSLYRYSQAELFAVSGWGQGALGVLALALASVLLACLYLGPIAQGALGHPLRPGLFLAQTPRLWRRLTAYLALVIGLVLVTVPVVGLGWVLFQTLHPFLGGLFLAFALSGGVVASVYLFLAKPAIFLEGLGAVAALKRSVTLTYRHFWSVLGLFLLFNLISLGLGLLLASLAALPWGLLLAMMGNAYLATGLSAAVMVYYLHRTGLSPEEKVT